MKTKTTSKSAFVNLRVLLALVIGSIGVLLALIGFGIYSGATVLAQKPKQNQTGGGGPQVVPMVGPVSQDQDLRSLPYIPAKDKMGEAKPRRTRYPRTTSHGIDDPVRALRQPTEAAAMPTPIATFAGMNSAQSGCGCLPPDTHGDVGPNHYVQSVNSSIKIFDKTGAALNGVNGTTYNSFFAPLGPTTPCGTSNTGDGFVFYDQLADRWVVSDFAFVGLPGPPPFYQCIGVSKTNDPVAGGWWLYALQVDPSNPTWVGDYPKFGLWPDAYYLSVNLFDGAALSFEGVRVYALPRSAMINGTGAPNPGAVAFTILPAGLGDSYSLVPATFRAGSAPPVGTPQYFMAIDSPATAGVVLTQVKTWRFHVDFVTPANSTFGIGANRTPNGTTTVNGFVDAFTTTTNLVPQPVTAVRLDTLGDKLMTPLVYQNLGGTESLWVSHTINNNQGGTGPTAIRWYQFDVTGSTIPATPVQQQTFNNGGDGLWRFMPSIAVDAQGNMAIGYSVSNTTLEPSIRYAGRLASDSLNTLAQGEAVLIAGGGHQTHSSGRWGDYSGMSIDPTDNQTFWHTNEYFPVNGSATWNTRVGKFKFPSALQLTAASSRKKHGTGGAGSEFPIPMPLIATLFSATSGVENRSGGDSDGGGAGDYKIVLTFNNPVTGGTASVTAHNPGGAGGVAGTVSFSGNDMIIPLSGVTDGQVLTVTAASVTDGTTVLPSVDVNVGFLIGDVNASRVVTGSDVNLCKAQQSQPLTATNFRTDVNASGVIAGSDVNIIKANASSNMP